MKLSQFDFELPDNLIAERPCEPREESRMLVYKNEISDTNFSKFIDYVGHNDLVVINNTKVIPIFLEGFHSKKNIKVTLHKKLSSNKWLAFLKPAKNVSENSIISFNNEISCTIRKKLDYGEVELEFNCSEEEFDNYLNQFGLMPLPPYIQKKRKSDKKDFTDYQTVYAKEKGSVAAPTAGLHFNDEIINKLVESDQLAEITLHVGAGTFLPIRNEDVDNHVMHSEYGIIDEKTALKINQCKKKGGKIIAVGTTTLRLLESAAKNNEVEKFNRETNIFIKPGYKFQIVDMLLTNFHLPKSTLLLLVSAFAGTEEIFKIYKHAVTNKYRFFSYGDVSLLFKK